MKRCRHLMAGRAVRSDLVIVSTPSLAFPPRLGEAEEPARVQALGAQATIERFDEGIVGLLARSSEVERDTILIGSVVQYLRYELGATIDTNRARHTPSSQDPRYLIDNLVTFDALIDLDRQCFGGIGIDQGQRPKTSAAEQRVRDKIHRPKFVRRRCLWLPFAPSRADMSARPLQRPGSSRPLDKAE